MVEFYNSAFALWIGGNNFSGGLCRPNRMHEVWRELGLSQLRLEQLSSLRKEIAMQRSRVLPGKYCMSDLMMALKETEVKADYMLKP